ncbi:MAG: MFS transporter, partial [Oscillospiraceae bacterium]|nr:MFS transporter [Oscillospiraceae bacterium]
ALGQGMMYAIMSGYISDFYMNVMGLSAMFVFWLTLISRFWDAVNDPIMGTIMDKANPKHGKMRTYLFYFPLPIALFTVMLFVKPNLSPSFMMIYAAATYTLWDLFYTVGDIPFWAAPNAMTSDAEERGKLASFARTANGVGSAIPMGLMMVLGPVLAQIAKMLANRDVTINDAKVDEYKFLITALIAAGIGGVLYFQTAFKMRERVPLPPQKNESLDKKAVAQVFKCKPLMLTAAMGILSGGRYMFQAATPHVARYAFFKGDIDAIRFMPATEQTVAVQNSISFVLMVFQVSMAAGMFLTMMVVPFLYKRFNYKQLVIGSCLLGGGAALAMYLIGYNNIYILIPLIFICSIPVGVINVVVYAMLGDCLDYMELTTGVRENGMGMACQSFVQKLSNAIATAAIVLTYGIVKLDVSSFAEERGANILSVPVERLGTVRSGMFSLVSLIPAISLLLCTIPMFFYDLTGAKKERVLEELAQKRSEVSEKCTAVT